MIIYKGYLKGHGKRSIEKFKDNPNSLVKYNTARRYDSFVGVLEDDYIMIDIDTIEESDLLLDIIEDLDIQCSVLETDNGIHVYFKGHDINANKIEWFSPIGVKVTAKLGSKNTADPLKIDGEFRPWIRKVDEHEPLPKWLHPVDRKYNPIDLVSDGARNQSLFNYILKLQSLNMSKPEIKETIRIINEYILDEPLDDNEIETITRDEAFLKKSFWKDKTFLHDEFAKYLIQEHHVIQIVGVLHIYKDGIYSDDQYDIERAMIKHLPMLTKARRHEVLSYLQLKAPEKEFSSENYIVVKNGIINVHSWTLTPFTPDIIVRNKVPIDFVPDAYHELTDITLNKIAVQDKKLRMLLDEIFGYTLFRRNALRKMFILTADGQNGKSTFLDMLGKFVGEDNTTSLELKELDQRFKTAELFGKLANIGDDISSEFIRNSSFVKKLATGNTVNVERKGADPFDFKNYAKLIFSANEPPKINDRSDGIKSRFMLIPFNARFTPEDPDFDPFIGDKVTSTEAMQYMLNVALKALERLLKNNKFTSPKVVEEETFQYEFDNNPVLQFIDDVDYRIVGAGTQRVYDSYVSWCLENGIKYPLNRKNFTAEVCNLRKLESKQRRDDDGKRKYVYVEIE